MIKLVNKYDRRNWKRGEKRGMEKVERNLEALGARLVADGRTNEMTRAFCDKKYRDELFASYFPEGLPDD